MKKIDRLGWAEEIAFRIFGVRVGVRINNRDSLSRIAPFLPPGRIPLSRREAIERLYSLKIAATFSSKLRYFHLLYCDAQRIARSEDLDAVLGALESDVQMYLAQSAHGKLFVHAGVVEWGGRAIIIPGRSFSGKTTLVAEFVRAGATYYSDEFAVFDKSGRVYPFSKSLGIRETRDSPRQTKYSISEYGGIAGTQPIPVGLVLATNYQRGGRWCPSRRSEGTAVLALLENTVTARREPELALGILSRVVRSASILQGERGEARHVVSNVLNELRSYTEIPEENPTMPTLETV